MNIEKALAGLSCLFVYRVVLNVEIVVVLDPAAGADLLPVALGHPACADRLAYLVALQELAEHLLR